MRISDWSTGVCSSDPQHPTKACPNQPSVLLVAAPRRRHQAGQVARRPVQRRFGAMPQVAQLARRARHRSVYTLRSEEHTSELQSLMRSSYAVFCLKNKTTIRLHHSTLNTTTTPEIISIIA